MRVQMNLVQKMDKLEESDRREVVAKIYEKFSSVLRKSEIVNKLVEMGLRKSSVYRYMKLLERGKSLDRKPGSGPQAIKLNNQLKKKLIKMVEGKVFPGYKKIGKKLGCSRTYAKKLIEKARIFVRNRQKCPKFSDGQKKE